MPTGPRRVLSSTRSDKWRNLRFTKTLPLDFVRERACGQCAKEEEDEEEEGGVCSKFCRYDESTCGITQNSTFADLMLLPRFVDEGFQKLPLLIRSGREFFGKAVPRLSLDVIFREFKNQDKLEHVRVVKDGKDQPSLSANSSTQTLLDMLQSNYSFSFLTEHLTRPNVFSRLTETVEDLIGVPVTTHVYLSPPSVHVFGPHRDPYPVIVCQLSGSKKWTICSATDSGNENQSHRALGQITKADWALSQLQRGITSIGTVGKDEELECEQFVLSTWSESECGVEKNVLYIPTGVVHTASADGDTHSLSISFGLQRRGLTWDVFLEHLVRASSKCQSDSLCSQAEAQILSILSTPSLVLPVWGQLPTVVDKCTAGAFAPFIADVSRSSCETVKSATKERIRELKHAWETIRAANGRELCASVEDFLLELCVVHNTQLVEDILLRMATETALDEAIQRYITVTNQRMQDHRNLTFHSPCGESRPMGRHLLQTNGVARDSPGVATADQCTSSCDWSCVNQGACGCDAGYDCRVSSWEVKCRHDDSCACDCCPSCSVIRNPRHPTFIPQPPTRIISAEVVVADACTNTSLKTRSAKPRVLLSTLILYEY
jgi:hypothetical protein